MLFDLFVLVPQFSHDVVRRLVRLVDYSVHHPQSVRLVVGLPVQVQHTFSVAHRLLIDRLYNQIDNPSIIFLIHNFSHKYPIAILLRSIPSIPVTL